MSHEVRVPEVGESVSEGLLVEWEKKNGDSVQVDEPLFVLETDKATLTVNAEAEGRLKILVQQGETVGVGQVVGRIEKVPQEVPRAGKQESAAKTEAEETQAVPVPSAEDRDASVRAALPAGLPPSIRRLLREQQIDPGDVPGSGPGGRVTADDVQLYVTTLQQASAAESRLPPAQPPRDTEAAKRRETREKMTPLRQRIAQRLVEVQQTAAILTTFNEADMSSVLAWRARYRETFREKHEVDLGLMSFFVKAAVEALQTVPRVNSRIEGDEIVQNFYYDIGIAVSTDRGLVVPVIRDADRLGFAELEKQISDFAHRARERTLTLEEMSGGCFTISNGGVFGSLLSTPILNPPQCGILGMHTIQRRPVAVGDDVQIRPMMYLALSYDHRIIDGRESVTFLRRIVDCIENPERMMLRI